MIIAVLSAVLLLIVLPLTAQPVTQERMQQIYEASQTPYKYGLVVAPKTNYEKYDCPTVFRQDTTSSATTERTALTAVATPHGWQRVPTCCIGTSKAKYSTSPRPLPTK